MFITTLNQMIATKKNRSFSDRIETAIRYLAIKILKYAKITIHCNIRDNTSLKFVARPGCVISEKLFVCGMYDYNGMSFMCENIMDSDIFYDIGANIGPFSLLLSTKTKNIYAFEGHPETAERLKINFDMNRIKTSQALNLAISDHTGDIVFIDNPGSSVNKIIENSNAGIRVNCTTVDALSNLYGLPTYIKIDTEGHELSVFLGMKDTISQGNVDFISFEANGLSTPDDLTQIFDLLKRSDYIIGNIDFQSKTFTQTDKPGAKSLSGDYHVISTKLKNKILNSGYKIIQT
jgi:FkbM family methyltransferase